MRRHTALWNGPGERSDERPRSARDRIGSCRCGFVHSPEHIIAERNDLYSPAPFGRSDRYVMSDRQETDGQASAVISIGVNRCSEHIANNEPLVWSDHSIDHNTRIVDRPANLVARSGALSGHSYILQNTFPLRDNLIGSYLTGGKGRSNPSVDEFCQCDFVRQRIDVGRRSLHLEIPEFLPCSPILRRQFGRPSSTDCKEHAVKEGTCGIFYLLREKVLELIFPSTVGCDPGVKIPTEEQILWSDKADFPYRFPSPPKM